VGAAAERLPFADQEFDAAMAVLSDHHWPDPIAGLREMRRVAGRVVIFQFDAAWGDRFWLTRDYLPECLQLFRWWHPTLTERAQAIGARMEPVPVPWDCADGFFYAYWRRPARYLEPEVRRGISVFPALGAEVERRMVTALRADLESGRWAARNRDIAGLEEADFGGRLLIA
jgi:SAM-dependent methyltransferase